MKSFIAFIAFALVFVSDPVFAVASSSSPIHIMIDINIPNKAFSDTLYIYVLPKGVPSRFPDHQTVRNIQNEVTMQCGPMPVSHRKVVTYEKISISNVGPNLYRITASIKKILSHNKRQTSDGCISITPVIGHAQKTWMIHAPHGYMNFRKTLLGDSLHFQTITY